MTDIAISNGLLERLNMARLALTEVESVEEALKIADFAESVRYAAKQAKAGMQAENFAAEVRLRAEKRAGELLSSYGGRTSGRKKVLPEGVRHGESHRYQQVAAVPDEVFEDYIAAKQERGEEITTNRLLRIAREAPQNGPDPNPLTVVGSAEIRHGDLRTILDDLAGQVDAIITDPPYPAEYLDEYDALGETAARILKPNGLLVAMVGPTHLPEYIRRLGQNLTYRWIGAYLMDGPAARVHGRKVGTKWKPLLIYGGSQFITQDVFRSHGDDKQHHHWGQSESGMADIVERLTEPGQLIVDPFLGGGTTAVVCKELGRRFVGCDIDPDAISTTLARLT